jgi:hypothetical protein
LSDLTTDPIIFLNAALMADFRPCLRQVEERTTQQIASDISSPTPAKVAGDLTD